jgi:hypothetical protein
LKKYIPQGIGEWNWCVHLRDKEGLPKNTHEPNTWCEIIDDKKYDDANSIKNKASELMYMYVELWQGKMAPWRNFGENEWIIHCRKW